MSSLSDTVLVLSGGSVLYKFAVCSDAIEKSLPHSRLNKNNKFEVTVSTRC